MPLILRQVGFVVPLFVVRLPSVASPQLLQFLAILLIACLLSAAVRLRPAAGLIAQ